MANSGNPLGTIFNIAERIAQTGAKLVNNAAQNGVFSKLIEGIRNGINSFAPLIVQGFQNGVQALRNITKENNILSILSSDSINKVTGLIKNIGEKMRDFTKFNVNLFNRNPEDSMLTNVLKDTITDVIDPLNIVSKLTNKINNIRENLNPGDRITAIDPTKIGWFGEFLNGKYQSIQERFAGFQGKLQELGITGIVSEKMEEAKSQLGQSLEQFKQQFPILGRFLGKTAEEAEAVDQEQGSIADDKAQSESESAKLQNGTSEGQKFNDINFDPNKPSYLLTDKDGNFVGWINGKSEDGNSLRVMTNDGKEIIINKDECDSKGYKMSIVGGNGSDKNSLNTESVEKPTTQFLSTGSNNKKNNEKQPSKGYIADGEINPGTKNASTSIFVDTDGHVKDCNTLQDYGQAIARSGSGYLVVDENGERQAVITPNYPALSDTSRQKAIYDKNVAARTVTIPKNIKQNRSFYTKTNYESVGWAKGSEQRKLYDEWKSEGGQYKDNIAVKDGRYLVATTDKIGKVGDNITVTMEDGSKIKCTIADAKSSKDSNFSTYGHECYDKNGKYYGVNIIEFETAKHYDNPGTANWDIDDRWDQKIASITNESK